MTTATTQNANDSLAKKNGDRWEDYVRAECDALHKRELARVSKNFEADRVPGMQVRREPSKPDFSGHLLAQSGEVQAILADALAGEPSDILALHAEQVLALRDAGRHVIFEAKATFNKTNFQFSNITDFQRGWLHGAHEAGAVSFVYLNEVHGDADDEGNVVRIEREREWVVPWCLVLEIEAGGRKSFPFTDAYQLCQKRRQGRYKESWLDTWERLESEGLI